MKKFVGLIMMMASVFSMPSASAYYNANFAGELEGYYIYADGDFVYLRLKNQSSVPGVCNTTYFVIPETVPADRRKMMVARLSVAFAMKETVNIGYDAEGGDCVHGYLRVHRVG